MKISDLEFLKVAVPGNGPSGPVRALLVRIVTERGLEGWGEAELTWRHTELEPRREMLLATLAGRSIFDIEELLRLDVLRHPPLAAAIETACWDLVGKIAGEPLCHLWGGAFRRRVPLIPRLAAATSADDEAVLRRARELVEQGYHAQVVHSCGEPQADLALLSRLRDVAGGRGELWLDGRGGYTSDAARDLCGELEAGSVRYFLDPISPREFDSLSALQMQTTTELGACRGIAQPSDVMTLVRGGAVGIVLIAPALVGGLAHTARCAVVAQAGSLSAGLGIGPAVGPAMAAMLQLAAAGPALSCGVATYWHQLPEDVLSESLEIVDGMASVPLGPGLGIDVDRAKVDEFLETS